MARCSWRLGTLVGAVAMTSVVFCLTAPGAASHSAPAATIARLAATDGTPPTRPPLLEAPPLTRTPLVAVDGPPTRVPVVLAVPATQTGPVPGNLSPDAK